jgi:hypothetical protein
MNNLKTTERGWSTLLGYNWMLGDYLGLNMAIGTDMGSFIEASYSNFIWKLG